MFDVLVSLARTPHPWVTLILAGVALGAWDLWKRLARRLGMRQPRFRPGAWLRRNYWLAMLLVGMVLALGSLALYLVDIGFAVRALVARLRAMSESPWSSSEDVRNTGTTVAVLLGAMAAAATLIFQLVKVWTTERATTATEEALTTERITKAVAGLGAQKEVNYRSRMVLWKDDRETREGFVQRWGEGPDIKHRLPSQWRDLPEAEIDKHVSFGEWENVAESQPNLEVRIGAIFALERISQDSARDHVQIMEILCAYVRENAPAAEAADFPGPEWQPLPDDASAKDRAAHLRRRKERFGGRYLKSEAWNWAQDLRPRTDIQVAAQVIGRRTGAQVAAERADLRHGEAGYRLDLRAANLQGVDLTGLDIRMALLKGARLEGALLIRTRMEGANLVKARMAGANLIEARMEGADFWTARMEGANLGGAHFDAETNFTAAVSQYAAMKSVDLDNVTIGQDQVNSLFGDGSVTLPDDLERPGHWAADDLDRRAFETQWRAWQVERGYRTPAKCE